MGSKLRITKTLLDSWLWSYKTEDGYEKFLKTLNREKIQPTTQMLMGTQFENVLNNVLNGEYISPDHEWYPVISEMSEELQGSQQQVVLFRDITVDGVDFLLHGVLDYLRASVIFDCKFTKNYYLNKYFSTTVQHSMYMELVPEARLFEYIISDGNYVYREKFPRDIVEPIEPTIRDFMKYLDMHNLVNIYAEKWRVN